MAKEVFHFLNGCPFPDECNKEKTTSKPKKLRFWGWTVDDCKQSICEHLKNSQLHDKINTMDEARAALDQLENLDIQEGEMEQANEEPPSSQAKARAKSPGVNRSRRESGHEDRRRDRSDRRDRRGRRRSRSRSRSGGRERAASSLVEQTQQLARFSALGQSTGEQQQKMLKLINSAADAAFMAKSICEGASAAFDEVGTKLIEAKRELLDKMVNESASSSRGRDRRH